MTNLRRRRRRIGAVAAAGVLLAAASPARGAVWSFQRTPFPDLVSSVACASARACIAVGGDAAMGWDGTRWRVQGRPAPEPGGSSLAGVSCTSSRTCVAVGDYLQSLLYDPNAMHTVPVLMPLAELWNGVRWSLLPFPGLPPGGQDGDLDAISCTPDGACMAAGRVFGASDGLFAERWGGSGWSLESMPDPVPARTISDEGAPTIGGLSCSSRSFCTAVGFYSLNAGPTQTFAERWDGSSWSVEPTPTIAGAFATELLGVSCASPSACVAVGESPQAWRALAERWNGTSWSVESTPSLPGGATELTGVSCASTSACVAVGETGSSAGSQPLVERSGGTGWSLERTPSPGVDGLRLQAISCTSTVVCTAVGDTRAEGVMAVQSAPPSAKLTGVPTGCTSTRLTLHVTGAGIASVAWSLDGKRITGHGARRGTEYAASIRLSPGRHEVTVKVRFTVSSQTRPLTFRRHVLGCSPGH